MTTVLVGLSPEACDRILELLEAVPTEFDSKIAAELRVAMSHAEPDSQRPSRLLDAEHGVITGSPGIAKSKGAQSKAAVVADKMAKAARKAVDTHEEESDERTK
jgi:hypothetical protein